MWGWHEIEKKISYTDFHRRLKETYGRQMEYNVHIHWISNRTIDACFRNCTQLVTKTYLSCALNKELAPITILDNNLSLLEAMLMFYLKKRLLFPDKVFWSFHCSQPNLKFLNRILVTFDHLRNTLLLEKYLQLA